MPRPIRPIPALALLLFINACEDGASKSSKMGVDKDGDGHSTTGANPDCDDKSPEVYPDAPELCDGLDNDCDGEEDEGLPLWYADADGDNAGDVEDEGRCDPPAEDGWTQDNTDCDDLEPDVYPGAPELCDGLDNDCDPHTPTDEGASILDGAIEVWPDRDEDGEGDSDSASVLVCELADGYAENDLDCDDDDFGVHTSAEEVCDGLDNDCDDEIDEDAIDAVLWCPDADGDGFTAEDCVGRLACEGAAGELERTEDSDWDDHEPRVNPDADEVCDGLDNDQNGAVDDDAPDAESWWPDVDEDGFGDAGAGEELRCDTPLGMVTNAEDCDDSEPRKHEGHTELCGDGLDNDCNDETDIDCPNNYEELGPASEWFAGDVNGDGLEDVILFLCSDTEPDESMDVEAEPDDCDAADELESARYAGGYSASDSDSGGDSDSDSDGDGDSDSGGDSDSDSGGDSDSGETGDPDGCWLVALSNGSSFDGYNIWADDEGADADYRFVVDVSGDGHVDLVWAEDTDDDGLWEWSVALADTNTWTFVAQPGPWMVDDVAFGSAALRLMGDVSGDGFADIVTVTGDEVYTALGTGASFGGFGATPSGDISTVSSSKPYNDPDKFMLADVTGNGNDDLVVFYIDEDSDDYGSDGETDVSGAWLVMISRGATFNPPRWWLGVGDYCVDKDAADPMGCGDWSDDVFVANYSGVDTWRSLAKADAIGYYELDAEDIEKERESHGRFFGGISEYDLDHPGASRSFDDTFEKNPLLGTQEGFALCATQSTFVAEGARTDLDAYRAILFADVDGDGQEDALAFRDSTGMWEVALADSGGKTLTRASPDDHFSWGPTY